jgi:hypothetical protein
MDVVCSECKRTDPNQSQMEGRAKVSFLHLSHKHQMEYKEAAFPRTCLSNSHSANSQLSHQTINSLAEMALVPILNSARYKIRNLQYGAIRDDEGALGAKGNSKTDELEVSDEPYGSPLCAWSDAIMNYSGSSPGTKIPRTPSLPLHLVLRPILEALSAKLRSDSISALRNRHR